MSFETSYIHLIMNNSTEYTYFTSIYTYRKLLILVE